MTEPVLLTASQLVSCERPLLLLLDDISIVGVEM
jgi:hypothetical protein